VLRCEVEVEVHCEMSKKNVLDDDEGGEIKADI
jgi:hypothetical protein